MEADVLNKGSEAFDLTFCFHTYFKVPDVRQAKITDFKGLKYTDKTAEGWPEVEEAADEVALTDFTDRVYAKAPNTCYLVGVEEGGQKMKLTKENLDDFVVWNPWDKNKLADMAEDEFNTFICVEAAQNSTRINLEPGQKWTAKHVMGLE